MSSSESDQGAILLGTAHRTINPPPGLWLMGYPNPHKRGNTGVAIDLCARAMVFGSPHADAPAAAVVVLDTLDVQPPVVARIRQAASARIDGMPAESIMVVATHTHSAPTLSTRRFAEQHVKQSTLYVEQTVNSAADALAAAWTARKPARMRVGCAECRIGHNRRVVDEAGKASNVWEDVDGRHTGFFNPNVRFLTFDDSASDRPRAILSFYACHPVTLGPRNTLCSADYPGHFIRAVEAALPGCAAIHITGAAADINPRHALAGDADKAKPPGEALARALLEAVPHARPVAGMPLAVRVDTLSLPLAPEASQNYSGRAADSVDGKTITAEIQILRLGDVAIIGAPGELFGELGLAIENTSPFQTTLIAGYANDNLGYLFTDTARREGGYEVQGPISHQIERRLLPAARAALQAAQ